MRTSICWKLLLPGLGYIALVNCGGPPKRPKAAHVDAVAIPTVKDTHWQHCMKIESGAIQCSVWSSQGHLLIEEEFVASDGSSVWVDELTIVKAGCASTFEVCLANGKKMIRRRLCAPPLC